MSIASEIERLQYAKSALKTQIEEKGVSVPSELKLSSYWELVRDIPSVSGSSRLTFDGLDVSSILLIYGNDKELEEGVDYLVEDGSTISFVAPIHFPIGIAFTIDDNIYSFTFD